MPQSFLCLEGLGCWLKRYTCRRRHKGPVPKKGGNQTNLVDKHPVCPQMLCLDKKTPETYLPLHSRNVSGAEGSEVKHWDHAVGRQSMCVRACMRAHVPGNFPAAHNWVTGVRVVPLVTFNGQSGKFSWSQCCPSNDSFHESHRKRGFFCFQTNARWHSVPSPCLSSWAESILSKDVLSPQICPELELLKQVIILKMILTSTWFDMISMLCTSVEKKGEMTKNTNFFGWPFSPRRQKNNSKQCRNWLNNAWTPDVLPKEHFILGYSTTTSGFKQIGLHSESPERTKLPDATGSMHINLWIWLERFYPAFQPRNNVLEMSTSFHAFDKKTMASKNVWFVSLGQKWISVLCVCVCVCVCVFYLQWYLFWIKAKFCQKCTHQVTARVE